MRYVLVIAVLLLTINVNNSRGTSIRRAFDILETIITQGMADNVLTQDERDWLQDRSVAINQFAKSEFSGHVSVEERATYSAIAGKVNGARFNTCWTCGGSLTHLGRLLKQAL